jgi:uncharacterized protein YkwD
MKHIVAATLFVILTLSAPARAQLDPETIATLLAAHNAYRTELGLPPLQWSDALATRAQNWANHLIATNTFAHNGAGQNLAWATAGSASLTQLVSLWASEKPNFTDGTFPATSLTGNWMDTGHYSQLIWSTTTNLGCGYAEDQAREILVCNYNPPGNIEGQKPY